LQNPVNHQNFERTLRFWDTPRSMLVGVSAHQPSPTQREQCWVRWSLGVDRGKSSRPPKSRPADALGVKGNLPQRGTEATLFRLRASTNSSANKPFSLPFCGCGKRLSQVCDTSNGGQDRKGRGKREKAIGEKEATRRKREKIRVREPEECESTAKRARSCSPSPTREGGHPKDLQSSKKTRRI